eukprot:325367-Prorocentrum_minimum.AAC.2
MWSERAQYGYDEGVSRDVLGLGAAPALRGKRFKRMRKTHRSPLAVVAAAMAVLGAAAVMQRWLPARFKLVLPRKASPYYQ